MRKMSSSHFILHLQRKSPQESWQTECQLRSCRWRRVHGDECNATTPSPLGNVWWPDGPTWPEPKFIWCGPVYILAPKPILVGNAWIIDPKKMSFGKSLKPCLKLEPWKCPTPAPHSRPIMQPMNCQFCEKRGQWKSFASLVGQGLSVHQLLILS